MRRDGIRKRPPLKENQAIVSTDTEFGIRDYFLVEVQKVVNGKKKVERFDIDLDEWIDYIKTLRVDYSNRKMTGYCLPGTSFRAEWRSIPTYKKVAV